VVVLFALGLGWFIVVHRRKTRREKTDGSPPEHIPTIHEIGHTSKLPEKNSLTPISTPPEIGGTEVQTWNELSTSSSTDKRHELQDSVTSPQLTELGTGAGNWPQESSSPASRSHIQQKSVSPVRSSFPPPWDTSLQQGNDERQEQPGIEQSQDETRNTGAGEMVIEPDDQDPELLRLEEEMAKVKAEGERLQRLHYLGLREEELKRTIEERRKGSVGASSS
jgi:hypothetical protein